MVTYCWTVLRQVAPRLHHHVAHLAHRSGRILHRLPKFAHHPFHPTMLVCRALPLALTAGLLNVTPAEPPAHPVAPPAYVQPVREAQFVPPYLPPGPPALPNPFACCAGQFNPPGGHVPYTPPDTPPVGDPGPPGDPPIIVTTFSDSPPTNSVDEPSSGIVVLGGLASLLLVRQLRRRLHLTPLG